MRYAALIIVAIAVFAAVPPAAGQIIFPDSTQQDSAGVVYTRIVVVNSDGTDTDNGTALLNALSGITTAAVGNRFMVQLEPGVYDLGASTLAMKAWVDLQGAGLTNTIVTSTGTTTLALTDNAFLRSVTLRNSGSNSVVLRANGITSEGFRVNCVHLGASGTNRGILVQNGGMLTLTNSTVSADAANTGTNIGAEVTNTGSQLDLRSASVNASNASTAITGLQVGATAVAVLGFAQITTAGTDTGVNVVSTGVVQMGSSAVSSDTTAFGNAGVLFASTTVFIGARTGAGTAVYAQCVDGASLAPIIDTVTAVP